MDYKGWIETTLFEVPPGTNPAQAPRVRKKRKIPRSGTPAAIKAVSGLAWIFLFLNLSKWYNLDLVLGDSFTAHTFLRRVWYLEMLGFTTRLKYYGVWSLTEGACILSGLGYNGVDPKSGRVRWDRLQNVKPWNIESAQNSRAYLENWNINTNNWLRNCVYLRVTPKGRKPGFRATLATFFTSAFWHGFYPGYYLSFVFAAFIQTAAKSRPPSPSRFAKADPGSQTSAVTFGPSSSRQTVRRTRLGNLTMTMRPTLPRSQFIASPQSPSWLWLSRSRYSFGRAFISLPFWQWAYHSPSLVHRPKLIWLGS